MEISRDSQASILLVELTRLGDVLSAIPAVATIRCWFPNASITLLTRTPYTAFLREAVSGVRFFELPDSRTIGGFLSLLLLVRRTRWSLACSLGPGRSNGLTVLLSGAASRVGYLECSPSETPFRRSNPIFCYGTLPKRVTAFGLESIADRSLKVCSALGIVEHVNPFPLSISSSGAAAAQAVLSLKGIHTGEGYMVIHPFSGWNYRSWPVTHFIELMQLMLDRFRWRIIVMGQISEQQQFQVFRQIFQGNRRVMILPSSDLIESAEVLRHAVLMIGNDSGPLHLAAALGTPAIGLFGPAEPSLTAPTPVSPDRLISVYHRLGCSPCDQARCLYPQNSCMQQISVAEAMRAVEHMFQWHTAGAAGSNA